jgi:hypothetical protein
MAATPKIIRQTFAHPGSLSMDRDIIPMPAMLSQQKARS